MSVALIQSPDDFALLEAGWFRSPSTTDWVDLLAPGEHGSIGYGCEQRRVVVSPPEQCIPHPCPNSEPLCLDPWMPNSRHLCEGCDGNGMWAEPFLVGVEQYAYYQGGRPPKLWAAVTPDMATSETGHAFERRQALLVRVTLLGGPIPVVEWNDGTTPPTDPELVVGQGGHPVRLLGWDDALTETDLTSVLGGKAAPGDQLYRATVTPLNEPITETIPCIGDDHPCEGGVCFQQETAGVSCAAALSLPLGEFVSLEMEQP